jgi:signal transduction histidine kinase
MSEPSPVDLKAARTEEFTRSLGSLGYCLSHECLGPLRQVHGFALLLAEELDRNPLDKLGSEARGYVNLVEQRVRRVHALVMKTCHYWRVSIAERTSQSVECEEIFQKSLANLKPAIEESGATVTHESLPRVIGDASQLLMLTQNLLDNAIRFRDGNPPRIHVSARQSGREWEIAVRDNGIGIDPKDFDRLFLPCQCLHARDESAGMGIGLATCKRIVEQNGGRIWVESARGEGSIFHFTIPTYDDRSSRDAGSNSNGSSHTIPQLRLQVGELIAMPLREIEARLIAINTPLETLQRTVTLPPKLQEYEAQIVKALAWAQQRLMALQEFAGLSSPSLVWIDVPDLLRGLRVLLGPYLRALGILLEVECGEDLRIQADPEQLKQVLNELVQNAADSIGENRKTTTSRRGSVEPQSRSQGPETGVMSARPEDRIRLRARKGDTLIGGFQREGVLFEVEDTGPGIPAGFERRIFDLFFSTKPGRVGIGLARSARIIENQGGILNFESHPGKGTTFRIALPAETAP